jgi:hypothetical protein
MSSSTSRRTDMLPTVRFAFVPGAIDIGNVVLRANECVRASGIKPIGFIFSDEARMTFSLDTYAAAVAVLDAAGFKFTVGQ